MEQELVLLLPAALVVNFLDKIKDSSPCGVVLAKGSGGGGAAGN